jgi:hypothetical protein
VFPVRYGLDCINYLCDFLSSMIKISNEIHFLLTNLVSFNLSVR